MSCLAAEAPKNLEGMIAARSFVDGAQVVSRYDTELYAHQSAMRIVKGIAYVAYQCNDTSPQENVAGQKARLAIFNILNPTATAKWLDIAQAGDSSDGITITGNFVSAPMPHAVADDVLRLFFTGRQGGDTNPLSRLYYKDLTLSTGQLSGLHQAKCTIAQNPGKVLDLETSAVQAHLDSLFGEGFGAQFANGINASCDIVEADGTLYSTIQIKSSAGGKTRFMTNVLMRSTDHGATWELLGAPDPRLVPGEVKILAEPALTLDRNHFHLHLRSNVVANGYLVSKAARTDLYHFDTPVRKWGYGIGRPAVCDFGKPIGLVAMFTAPSVSMGGATMTRNKCDVVTIDAAYHTYSLAFSVVDYDAVNTPFMHKYNDEVYVSWSTGRRRLIPKFGTSEIVFSKLRREYFLSSHAGEMPEQ